jgi:CubicO group peptidase (beta-lactamase class C family)
MKIPVINVLRFGVAAMLCVVYAFAHASDVFPNTKWTKAVSAEASGWSSQKLKTADDFARTLNTDAYLVVHGGQIIHEYGNTSRPTNLHSIRKSVLSVLFGIYVDRGVVDLSKTLRELNINDRSELTSDERTATVKDLLQARSGIYHPAAYETRDMAVNRPIRGSSAPGQRFYYNNWDFNALGTIFKQLSGKTVFEALRDDLAGPLQFQDFSYLVDTKFQYESISQHPAYVIRLSARDLARIGLLMARNGRWNENQILSKAWVAESTSSYSSLSARTGYGYMWWVGIGDRFYLAKFPGKVFSAEGSQGQFMIVDPLRDLVIVHRVNSDNDITRNVNGRQFQQLLQLILDAQILAP